MPIAAGTRLGPYEVLAPLGAGGMGEVYKARDTRLDRTVAIKVLPQHISATPEIRSRFEREARAVSSLNHPHICTLHDIGEQDGIDFIVMEYIEGETLATRLERGPLPTADVLRYAAEVADALDKAHRQGLIHRDLKPGNVMLTKSGAKLLDFGLARVIGPTAPGVPGSSGPSIILSQVPTQATPLTGAGMIVGTFQYMAPEQLEGGEADARSDIWAFGATVYEMATGKTAFSGHSQASLIASILREQPPPISEVQPLTPPGLDRIVQRCLAKDPDERWQTARDLAHELTWIAQAGSKAGVPAPVAAQRRSRERLWMIAAAAGVLLSGALLALLLLSPKPPEPSVVRFDVRPPSSIQFADAPRVSPDGRYLAYAGTDSTGVSRVWLRPMSGASATAVSGTEGISLRPFWSPDSKYLGFFAGGKLKKIAIGGGPSTVICDAPTGADGAWSPRGTILFDGANTDPILQVPASGGTAVAIIRPDTAKSEIVGWPYFLPDGRHFLFVDLTSGTLRLGELGSTRWRELGKCETRAEYARDGYVLFVRGTSLVAQPFDARALKLTGEAFPIAEPVRTQGGGGADFSVSENGTLVYQPGTTQDGELDWVDRTGRALGKVPLGDLSGALNPALSPDGRRVAFRVLDPRSNTRDLWIADLVRGVSTRFTFDKGNENHGLFSPDGRRIAYWANPESAIGIYLKDASGAGAAQLAVPTTGEASVSDWSHDGRLILYAIGNGVGAGEVWSVAIDGDRKPTRALGGDGFDYRQPRLSPDGKWLVYASNESGRSEVYVQSFPEHTGKWQISTAGGGDPRWVSGGREIVYLSADSHIMSVAVRTIPSFEADVPKPLFVARVMLPALALRAHYDVSPDGQRFLLGAPFGSDALEGANVVLDWAADVKQK
jgi:serine/threonine protein kinase/WD40 repeat protein